MNTQIMADKNLIYLCRHGSVSYGLDTPTSDLDIKGIFIPDLEYYFGMKEIEQQEYGQDRVVYALKKFVKLARDCNPNIIEVLFCDESDILYMNDFGKKLRDNRHLFLSTKARFTFSGYAMAQMLRIKNHRKWIMNPQVMPNEKDFFKEKDMKIASGEVVHYTKFMEEEYDKSFKKYNQYQEWLKNRNETRSKLEEKYGFDTKHGMHLVRLLRMGLEILTTGEVKVRRPDREELLGIRNGTWSYDQLIEYSEKLDSELQILYPTSPLPHSPKDKEIDELLIQMNKEFLLKEY